MSEWNIITIADFEKEYVSRISYDELVERAEAAEARAKELEAASRWIPVSERLPQEAQEVIVISSNGYVCKWFHANQMRQAFLTHWTHWRPFEPPQEVEG